MVPEIAGRGISGVLSATSAPAMKMPIDKAMVSKSRGIGSSDFYQRAMVHVVPRRFGNP
jgi:hypothetical protein